MLFRNTFMSETSFKYYSVYVFTSICIFKSSLHPTWLIHACVMWSQVNSVHSKSTLTSIHPVNYLPGQISEQNYWCSGIAFKVQSGQRCTYFHFIKPHTFVPLWATQRKTTWLRLRSYVRNILCKWLYMVCLTNRIFQGATQSSMHLNHTLIGQFSAF